MADVLIVTGIWPPQVGGPASHGPDLARFLLSRGHRVRAITMVPDGRVEPSGVPLLALPGDRVLPLRLASGARAVVGAARRADVVYSTSMYARSALAATVSSLPLVLKLVNDPAYERARTLGLFGGSQKEFQAPLTDPRLNVLKLLRGAALRRATRIITPGRFLADLAVLWGVDEGRIRVVPNPAPTVDRSVPVAELRRRFGMQGPTAVFAGRFVLQKNVPLAIHALRDAPGVSLVLVGDGPERPTVEEAVARAGVADRVRMVGAVPRAEAVAWMRAADVVVLSSDWEGFPHAAVEALAAGTPVVATAVGAVDEIVLPGHNGLLVARGDARGLGAALAAVACDEELRAELCRGAAETGRRFLPEHTFRAIEEELIGVSVDNALRA